MLLNRATTGDEVRSTINLVNRVSNSVVQVSGAILVSQVPVFNKVLNGVRLTSKYGQFKITQGHEQMEAAKCLWGGSVGDHAELRLSRAITVQP